MYICQHPENTRVGANCNSPFHMGEFEMWTKYNVGELGCGRISIRPYDACKRTYAMPVMLFAYNICQRSDNARVGANCNSPIHCGQFALSCM